jgi:hypothetical protein
MLNKDKRIKLTELLQDQFLDLDIVRDKPLILENRQGLFLIIKSVLYIEHDKFLKEMSQLILKYYDIFGTVEFLDSDNYRDLDTIQKMSSKISIFTANKKYSNFKKDSIKFVCKWAFVSKKKNVIKIKHKPSLCKKYLKWLDPSEFIYILFLLFIMNFDIVKKNLIEFMKTMGIMIKGSNTQKDTSFPGTLKGVVTMPKYSKKPYPRSILNLLEQQSKM